MKMTTSFTNILEDQDQILTGEERYPVMGSFLTEDQASEIYSRLTGLNRYWNCIDKARITLDYLGRNKGIVVYGSTLILCQHSDHIASYGYLYNPPYEFHAWVSMFDGYIIDCSLPGVIEKGLNTSDEKGPFLVNMNPFIFAGPKNMLPYIRYTRFASGECYERISRKVC
jgi:hypothetical protein